MLVHTWYRGRFRNLNSGFSVAPRQRPATSECLVHGIDYVVRSTVTAIIKLGSHFELGNIPLTALYVGSGKKTWKTGKRGW